MRGQVSQEARNATGNTKHHALTWDSGSDRGWDHLVTCGLQCYLRRASAAGRSRDCTVFVRPEFRADAGSLYLTNGRLGLRWELTIPTQLTHCEQLPTLIACGSMAGGKQ